MCGKLIWSFDIATPESKDITEVAVDAITGEVVSVEMETPKDQTGEKAEDGKKKKDKDGHGHRADSVRFSCIFRVVRLLTADAGWGQTLRREFNPAQ